MRLLGYEIVRRNGALIIHRAAPANLQSVPYSLNYGYWPQRGYIHEPFSGAWQRNITADSETSILAFSAVFACVTGIAADVAKMRIKLSRNEDGIWTEITSGPPWLSVLRKPNHYQTRIKFVEQWVVSKLLTGNTYVLKERDERGVVRAMYVLDPRRVQTLVSEDGEVFYRLNKDPLSQVNEFNYDEDSPVVPASEIIHDMMVSLWHPLVGVSPLYACAQSATMGNRIQANSTDHFGNRSIPGGVIIFPTEVDEEHAREFKKLWEENFGGRNLGRTAVLDNNAKFEVISMAAEASQLIEQLGWTVGDVARAFHYPAWKLGGEMPAYTKPELAMTAYYSDCLQVHIEAIELNLDEGLELPSDMGTEMDLDNLMRMDTDALYASNNLGVSGGWMSPDEARNRANMKPVPGGSSPMIQQQNYSLAALAKRDAKADPFEGATPKPAATPQAPAAPPATSREMTIADLEVFEADFQKELCLQ